MDRTCSGLLLGGAAYVIRSTETSDYTTSSQSVGELCHPRKIKVLIPATQLSLPHTSLVIPDVNSLVQMR
jgi:hypothetical protein